MAQITANSHGTVDHPALAERPLSRREHLRTVVPVTVAVLLLLGVVLTAALALQDLLDFGVWFLSER